MKVELQMDIPVSITAFIHKEASYAPNNTRSAIFCNIDG